MSGGFNQNWADRIPNWLPPARNFAVTALMGFLNRRDPIQYQVAESLIDRAVLLATAQLRVDTPFYFDSLSRLERWLAVVGYLLRRGENLPLRRPIPMLSDISDERQRSALLFHLNDGFRPNFALPYVFEITRDEALALLIAADQSYQNLFE